MTTKQKRMVVVGIMQDLSNLALDCFTEKPEHQNRLDEARIMLDFQEGMKELQTAVDSWLSDLRK